MPLRSKKIRQLGERVVVEMDVPDDWQPGRIHRVLPAVQIQRIGRTSSAGRMDSDE